MSRCGYLSAFAVAVLAACAQHEAEPPTALSSALVGGTRDSVRTFVVGIYTMEHWKPALCTGTLVAPDLVLTSRHCVAPRLDEDSAVDCMRSRFGATFDPERLQVTTAEHMYPEQLAAPRVASRIWVRETDSWVCGNDIALLALERAGAPGGAGGAGASAGADTGSASVGPGSASVGAGGAEASAGAGAALAGTGALGGDSGSSAGANSLVHETEPALPRLNEPAEPGERYAAVGYGSTGEAFGDRMALEDLEVGCIGAACSQRILDGEFFGAGGICRGDSGGPALDDQGRVVGVASRGDAKCTESVYSDVAAHKDWLIASAREASAYLGQVLPRWADDGSTGAAGAAGQAAVDPSGASGSAGSAGNGMEVPSRPPPEAPRPTRVRLGGGCAVVGARAGGARTDFAGDVVLVMVAFLGGRRRKAEDGRRRSGAGVGDGKGRSGSGWR